MAIYCPELNLSYIETPKTASIATSAFLVKHYNGQRVSGHHNLECPPNSFKISCVRNPYDLLCSIYYIFLNAIDFINTPGNKEKIQRPAWTTDREWSVFCNSTSNVSKIDFNHFLSYYPIIDAKLSPYYNMAQNGELDDWIYFENLQKDLDRILESRGVHNKFKIEFANTTKGKPKDYLSLYTPSTLGFVYKQNKSYCKFHGYYPPLI